MRPKGKSPEKSPKRKSKTAGKGKGRGRGRPILRTPSPTTVTGSQAHECQESEGQAPQNTEPDVAGIHALQTEGVSEIEGTGDSGGIEDPGQSTASSPSLSSASSQKSKKPKKSWKLTDDQEEGQVLEWVQEHPCLWDQNNKDFKNRAMKDRLWDEKAKELGYDVDSFKAWYTDLRDWNTKLHSLRSGEGQWEFTDRERWVMDRFMFFRSSIRHRKAPVKSLKEALTISKGDLDEAERIAAEDRIAIMDAKRLKHSVEDPLLIEIRKKFDNAQSELASGDV